MQVVGNEGLVQVEAFDYRVPAVLQVENRLGRNLGAREVVLQRGLGERRHHVEFGDGAGDAVKAGDVAGEFGAQLYEYLALERGDLLVRGECRLLVLLERGRDEPLGVDEGLFANVVPRDFTQVRLRHLDVVPEYFVVAHLERGDAGPFALGSLEAGDVFFGLGGTVAEVVEVRPKAAAYYAAFGQRRGWVVGDGVLYKFDQVGHVDEVIRHAREKRALGAGERFFEGRDEGEALPEGANVAGARRP